MINQMEEIGFSGESTIAFSETEMEAAEQLVQLSEEDTLSCISSSTDWSVCRCGGSDTKRQEDVVSSKVRDMVGNEQNDGVWRNKNVTDGRRFMKTIMETKTRITKKQKFRSLASIYGATKEMARN